ncbi:hypothetical protein HYW76_05455 [Candidatus Pacearchaeota archaeon]|nr:hypothetical protein [Candidatus Pacearchaeota archaeon]
MNLGVLGLILDIIGVFIITITEIVNPHYGKTYGQPLRKTYWWNGWRPFYKNTQTLKWVTKWNHKPVVEGMLPPKYKLEIIGLLFILIGFVLQLIFYLS